MSKKRVIGTAINETLFSSYECECGHRSGFSENTVKGNKGEKPKEKRVYLADSEPNEHSIVFHKGHAVEILCPKRQK